MARCSEATEGFRLGEVKGVCKDVGKGFLSSSDWIGIFFFFPHFSFSCPLDKCWAMPPG